MTDDPTLAALDQRGRRAAAGVRTAVAEHPAPVFEPDLVRIDVDARPTGGHRRSRPVVGLLVAAAAVLVVVAAVVVLAGTGTDDSAPADRIAPGELDRYLLPELPRGFELAYVRDVDDEVPTSFLVAEPMTVYGPDPSRPAAGVAAVEDVTPLGPGMLTADLDEVDVPGRQAWDGADILRAPSIIVRVGGDGGPLVAVVGAPADPAQLRDLAATVTVDDGAATVDADDLPDGWSDIGTARVEDGIGYVQGLRRVPGGVGWAAAYGRRRGTGRRELIIVSSVTGDPVRALATRLVTDDVEEVEVRGHPALFARMAGSFDPAGLVVTWEERPGEIVQVAGLDTLGRDGLLAIAEGIYVVAGDEVDDLRRDALLAGTHDPGVTVVGLQPFADGTEWLLAAGPADGEVVLQTVATPLGSSAFDAPDGAEEPELPFRTGVTFGTGADVGWAYGLITEDVAEVTIHGPQGDPFVATIVESEGVRGWVAELPPFDPEAIPAFEAQAISPEGTVIQTVATG